MAEVKWTAQALYDIETIAEFIARDSEKYAKIQVERFFQKVQILETFPQAGRIVPELHDPEIREIIMNYYRIIYRVVNEDRIDILTIHHTHKLLSDL